MTAPAPAPDQSWSRLHPLTPLLRGGRIVVVALGVLADRSVRSEEPVGSLVVLAVVAVVSLIGGWVSWRMTRYRVDGADLRVESGVLVRRSRRVPLARLQAVDVVRPLLARVFGLAELRLEVVGQGDTEAPLAYLRDDEAERLRARLLALSAGLHETTPAAPERPLVSVPTRALVVASLLSVPSLLLAGYVAAAVVVAAVVPEALPGLLAGLLPALVVAASVAWNRLAGEWGFTLAESPDGLRLRHGLLETRAQTIPPGRVQALRLTEPLLWRPLGWVRLEVDVAGYQSGRGSGEVQRQTSALLPVAPRALAWAVIARVDPGVEVGPTTLAPAPRRARIRAPLRWPNLGVGSVAGHTLTRTGVLERVTDVVSDRKVQSLRLVQGPLQRRLRLASLHVDTAGRSVRAVAAHRDAAEALALLRATAERARLARAGEPIASADRSEPGDQGGKHLADRLA